MAIADGDGFVEIVQGQATIGVGLVAAVGERPRAQRRARSEKSTAARNPKATRRDRRAFDVGRRRDRHGCESQRIRCGVECAVAATDQEAVLAIGEGAKEIRPERGARGPRRAVAGGEDDALFALEWAALEAAASDGTSLHVALLSSGEEDGRELDVVEEIALEHSSDLDALEQLVASGVPAPDVVLVPVPASSGGPVEAAHASAAWTLALLQARLRSRTETALSVTPAEAVRAERDRA